LLHAGCRPGGPVPTPGDMLHTHAVTQGFERKALPAYHSTPLTQLSTEDPPSDVTAAFLLAHWRASSSKAPRRTRPHKRTQTKAPTTSDFVVQDDRTTSAPLSYTDAHACIAQSGSCPGASASYDATGRSACTASPPCPYRLLLFSGQAVLIHQGAKFTTTPPCSSSQTTPALLAHALLIWALSRSGPIYSLNS